MKSIADIKREMVKGTFWHTMHNLSGKDMGVRQVSIVQSNSFAFKNPVTGNDSWCDWPKKNEVTFYPETPHKFSISHDGKMYLTYTKLEGEN